MRRPKPVTDVSPPSIETELAGLVTTRDNLQARQNVLAADVERAIATRRELLIQGGDAAAIAEAEHTVRELEGAALGVADALAEVERRIAAAEDRITDDRIRAERESAASTLDRDADAVDAAAARVQRAVADLVKAHASLIAAITPIAAPLFTKSDTYSPERIASYLAGQMLAKALPSLEYSEAARQTRWGWISAEPIEVIESPDPAAVFVTGSMRERAARIRDGGASPDLPRYVAPEPDFMPARTETMLWVTEPFRYSPKPGHVPISVDARQQHLPDPVAALAIERGFAVAAEPHNWQATADRRRAAGLRGTIWDLPDLGIDLEEWRQAEADRRRQAWLAEQDLAA
ncbi:hypothetical protein [Methylobacterium sp. ID0610]|uniref:hypothetical protein n=1 Tax=Methylobacterium carpenticola TaxID=3344827 RepID=UPI00367F12A5